MFFPESETIAREHVELGEVVRQIDEQLSRQTTTSPLRPEDFAAVLEINEYQVTSVFRLLEQDVNATRNGRSRAGRNGRCEGEKNAR